MGVWPGGQHSWKRGPDLGKVRLPGEIHSQVRVAEMQTVLQASPLTLTQPLGLRCLANDSAATTSHPHSLTVTWPFLLGVD